MKWFKHFSDSLDDPFIQELMDDFGPHGYVAWFGILEIIAKENGAKLTGKLEVKPSYVTRKLRISSTKLQRVFNQCSTKGKLSFNILKDKWVFDAPKLLKLKDNYSKDLQGTSKKPSNHKEEEEEEEEEVELKDPPIAPPGEGKKNGNNPDGKPPRSRKAMVPIDYQPPETVWKWARENEITDPEAQVQAFVDDRRAKAVLYLDLDAAFRTWLRNSKRFSPVKVKPKSRIDEINHVLRRYK